MKKNGWFCFALTAVMVLPAWSADEGKVYKYVDKSGKVTYSQIPPTDGKPAEKMDAKPALQGRAGGGPAYSPYDEPRSYRYQESYRTSIIPAQPSVTAQERKRVAAPPVYFFWVCAMCMLYQRQSTWQRDEDWTTGKSILMRGIKAT